MKPSESRTIMSGGKEPAISEECRMQNAECRKQIEIACGSQFCILHFAFCIHHYSTKVTLLISLSVVRPSITLVHADSLSTVIPYSLPVCLLSEARRR